MKRLLIIISVCLLSSHCFTQSVNKQIDSLKRLIISTDTDTAKLDYYLEISSIYRLNQPYDALKFGHIALALAKRINYGIGATYEQIFLSHKQAGTHADSLKKYADLLQQDYGNSDNDRDKLISQWSYAFYYERISQSDKVIEAYLNCLKILKNSNDAQLKRNEPMLLNNIAEVFIETDRQKKALEYYQKALERVEDDYSKANMIFNIATIYRENLHKGDTAQVLLDEAFELYQKVNSLDGIVDVLVERAKYNDEQKQYERANQYYLQALEIIENNNLKPQLLTTLFDFANHYQLRRKYSKSIYYGERALEEANRQGSLEYLEQIYSTLNTSYTTMYDYKNANRVLRLLIEYKDSIQNTTLQTRVEELKTQFEVDQKEMENDLLKAETAANKKTIQSKNATTFALALILLLIASWACLIYYTNRQRKKYNKELKLTVEERTQQLLAANNDLIKANSELKTFNYIASHDIKEPVRNIGNYAGLIFRKLPNELKDDYKYYFDTIKRSARQLYTLIEDMARYTQLSKNENIELKATNLNTIIESLQINLETILENRNGCIINEGLPTVHTNSSMIYIVLKNLIENGIKFNKSDIPAVMLSSTEKDTYYKVIIKDNGIGIEEEFHHRIYEMFKRLHPRQSYEGTGIGLAIVKMLTDRLGITIRLESKLEEGSIFILEIPKEQKYSENNQAISQNMMV